MGGFTSAHRLPAPGRGRPSARRAPVLLSLLAALAPAASPAQQPEPDTLNRLGVQYTYTTFRQSLADWHAVEVYYRRALPPGFLIGRVNYAERFGLSGTQIEADAYPFLGADGYAYLNVGHSGDLIFPEWRFGAEAFTGLPGAWEASLGGRYMDFRDVDVILVTGSVGKYAGNWWVSLRPWWVVDEGDLTIELLARRYGAGADDFWGVRLAAGDAAADIVTTQDLERLRSYGGLLEGRRRFAQAWILVWGVGVRDEEIHAGEERLRAELRLGVERIF